MKNAIIYLFSLFSSLGFSQDFSSLNNEIHSIYGDIRNYNDSIKERSIGMDHLELKLVTINLGLLNTRLVSVPYYDERSKIIPKVLEEFIKKNRPQFFFIQELWHEDDFDSLLTFAANFNYTPAVKHYEDEKQKKRGLQILIDNNIVKDISGVGFAPYLNENGRMIRAWFEKLFGYQRGLLYFRFTTHHGQRILLGNTHLTATIDQHETRMNQIDRLVDILESKASLADYILLGADLNVSAELGNVKARELTSWNRNKGAYTHLYERINETSFYLMDTYRAVKDDEGFTQNTINTITALSSSTKNEPDQRLDYLFAGPTDKGSEYFLTVIDSYLVFDKPLSNETLDLDLDIDLYLSDHFGVASTVRIFTE